MNQKSFQKILIFLNLLVFAVTVYAYRWIFFEKFNPVYFKHFYDHSQWSIPNSPRIMGDGELYQYAGYRLLQGDSPFIVNPEAPPLGKYVYAMSIGLFNNAYLLNPFLLGSAMILMFFFVKRITLSTNTALCASLLLSTQPIIFSQLGDTAFELIHINLLMLYLIGFAACIDPKNRSNQSKYAMLVGMLLGAFTAVRFGLFSIALIIPSLIWLKKNNHLKLALPIMIFALITYIATYFRFFILGSSIIDWIKNQKWILDFYLSSEAPRNPLAFIGTSLFGLIKTETGWQQAPEWTVLWIIGFGLIFWNRKNHANDQIQFIKSVTITFALLLTIIPFGLRYIALIIPLYVISFTSLLKAIPKKVILTIGLLVAIQPFLYLVNRPFRDVDRINQLLSNNRFEDLYTITDNIHLSSDEFSFVINNFSYQIQADEGKHFIKTTDNNTLKNEILIIFTSKYQTPIGELSTQHKGILKATNGRWRLQWDWEFIAPHFLPESIIFMEKGNQLGGKLITADGIVLSEGSRLPYISLLTHRLNNEEQLLKNIKALTNIDPVESRALIHVGYPPNLPKRLGFVEPSYSADLLNLIATQSGVIITNENGPRARKYPLGAINQKLIDPIQIIEQANPNLTHFVQGSISISNPDREYLIYTAPPHPPTDVKLNQTIDELFGEGTRLLF